MADPMSQEVAIPIESPRHFMGQEICKPSQDERGCKEKEEDCPKWRAHCCDVAMPNGMACGSRHHTRLAHV